jgi:hypothetical protein
LRKNKVIVLFLVVLISGCTTGVSDEDIYRFKSDCPLSGSAKNLVLVGGKSFLVIGGDSELEDQVTLGFHYGAPGYLTFAPKNASVEFTVEQTVISDFGLSVNQGYYHFEEDGLLPAQVPIEDPPQQNWPERLYNPCPDAPGSENILLGRSKYPPRFAGLWWIGTYVRLDVWEDGTIEVNREGVEAVDDDDNRWVSKMVGGSIDAIVMVRDSNDG